MMKLATIGLTSEQAEAVASMLHEVEAATKTESEAVVEKSRSKARERVQRWRKKRSETQCNVTERNETSRNGLRARDARGDVKQNNLEIPKEDKKDNSAAKPLSDLSSFKAELAPILSAERIDALVELRRKKKAIINQNAGKLLAKALCACPDVGEAADEMVLRNWTSVKPEWLSSRQSTAPPTHAPPRERTILDVLNERIERADNERLQPATIDGEYEIGSSPSANLHFLANAARR
jgi:hypothetical protein